jgi:hypothetical protein
VSSFLQVPIRLLNRFARLMSCSRTWSLWSRRIQGVHDRLRCGLMESKLLHIAERCPVHQTLTSEVQIVPSLLRQIAGTSPETPRL